MDTNKIKIRVRKEVVLCAKCGLPKVFYYLSDFSYGEKLVLIKDGTEYAFVNLFEDKAFEELNDLVSEILYERDINLTKGQFADCVNSVYGVTYDTFEGSKVDFSAKNEKCVHCGAQEFETNLIEPEQLVDIEVECITHDVWNKLSLEDKKKLLETELRSKNFIE